MFRAANIENIPVEGIIIKIWEAEFHIEVRHFSRGRVIKPASSGTGGFDNPPSRKGFCPFGQAVSFLQESPLYQ
jgi:hypothetical protein